MASSKDVFAAIKTHWASSSLGAYNGPYFNQKPYNVAWPYVIFSSVSNTRTARSCANEYWECVFRFIVRSKKEIDAANALDTIAEAFDNANLTISNGTMVKIERDSEGYYSEDENVTVAWVQYTVLRSKSR